MGKATSRSSTADLLNEKRGKRSTQQSWTALWEISVHAKAGEACQGRNARQEAGFGESVGRGGRRHDEVSFRRRAQADSAGEAEEALGASGALGREDHDLAASVASLGGCTLAPLCFTAVFTYSQCMFLA